LKWKPGTGDSAKYFQVSEDMRWQICTVAGIATLVRLGGKLPELVMSGTIEECKREASNAK
jgi:hypothetical protein